MKWICVCHKRVFMNKLTLNLLYLPVGFSQAVQKCGSGENGYYGNGYYGYSLRNQKHWQCYTAFLKVVFHKVISATLKITS